MIERQIKLFQDAQSAEGEYVTKRKFINIPLDSLLLIGIINVFIIVFSFTLGIDHGKKLALARPKAGTYVPQKAPKSVTPAPGTDTAMPRLAPGKDESDPANTAGENDGPEENRYIVQVASYLQQTMASKEKEHLASQGFPAGVKKSGKYLVVYVGEFASRKTAEEAKIRLRKRYNDCFIRRLNS